MCKNPKNIYTCVKSDDRLEEILTATDMRLNGGKSAAGGRRHVHTYVAAEEAPVLKLKSFVTDEEFGKMFE